MQLFDIDLCLIIRNKVNMAMQTKVFYKEVTMLNELVQKAIKGDGDSFYELIQIKKEHIYKIAYSYVHNQEDALDVVHDAVYKAFTAIGSLKNPQYFSTWLTKITINCAIDHLNKTKKVISIEKSELENFPVEENDKEAILDLRQNLEKLDIKYKTVIILRYFEDLTLNEIATTLNLPINTIKAQLYRGLQKLKIQLEEGDAIEK